MAKNFNYILSNIKENKSVFVRKHVSVVGSAHEYGQTMHGVKLAYDNLKKFGLLEALKYIGWGYDDIGCININDDIEEKKHLNSKLGYKCGMKMNENHMLNNTENNNSKDENVVANNEYYNIKNANYIGKFCEKLFKVVTKQIIKKNFVINIGGDHSVAFGSILSSLNNYKNLKVIWIDAHADINIPETSPSGNYHGMVLAHLLNFFKKKVHGFEWTKELRFLKPEHISMIGLRSIDAYEKNILKTNNINIYTMFDIEKYGIYQCIKDALKKVDPHEICPLHVSLDIDGIDKLYAPATGTIARGGLTYREINLIMKILAETRRVVSMDLVEYNPTFDEIESKCHSDILPINDKATKTGRLCIELITRILDNDIL